MAKHERLKKVNYTELYVIIKRGVNVIWETPVMENLFNKLDSTALRQEVKANNIANLNTPGFKRGHVRSFAEEMERAQERLPLSQTHPSHLPGEEPETQPQVERETSTFRRTDGNNVDLEREMLDMVTNQIRYNALVEQISDRFSNMRYVINEGRG